MREREGEGEGGERGRNGEVGGGRERERAGCEMTGRVHYDQYSQALSTYLEFGLCS